MRNIRRFIRNLKDYWRFLMENEWWDHYFIYEVLKIKLEIDIKYYKKYAFSEEEYSGKIVEEMQSCIALIKKIQDDDYIQHNGDVGVFSKEFHKKCERAEAEKAQDIDNLFKYISLKIQGWWD